MQKSGRDYCNQLFKIEEDLANLSPEERYRRRLELGKPVLEAFWCWLENLNVLNGSALGRAVTYAKNQKPYMENYLLMEDVQFPTMQQKIASGQLR